MNPFDQRLQQLLSTASRTYAERGFHATSMRDLSAASGMSLAGIYHYVRSKQELLGLIQDRCFAEVSAGAHAAVDAASGAEGRLRAFIHHHVVYFTGHMDEMKVLAHEEAQLAGAMRSQVRRRKKEYVTLLSGLLAAVERPTVDSKVAAYALFGMINWIYTWYQPGGNIPPAQLADQLTELFLGGYIRGDGRLLPKRTS
ncbi:MAG: TetR/AcrR family transcriptional regulator [Gemmatimonadota bacterium]